MKRTIIFKKIKNNILDYDVAYKTSYGQSLCISFLIKYMNILENMMELNIWDYSVLMKNVNKFLIESDILLC